MILGCVVLRDAPLPEFLSGKLHAPPASPAVEAKARESLFPRDIRVDILVDNERLSCQECFDFAWVTRVMMVDIYADI